MEIKWWWWCSFRAKTQTSATDNCICINSATSFETYILSLQVSVAEQRKGRHVSFYMHREVATFAIRERPPGDRQGAWRDRLPSCIPPSAWHHDRERLRQNRVVTAVCREETLVIRVPAVLRPAFDDVTASKDAGSRRIVRGHPASHRGMCTARGLGSAVSSQACGSEPQRKLNLVHFSLTVWHLVAPNLLYFRGAFHVDGSWYDEHKNSCLSQIIGSKKGISPNFGHMCIWVRMCWLAFGVKRSKVKVTRQTMNILTKIGSCMYLWLRHAD